MHLNPRWKSNRYQEKDNNLQDNYLTIVSEMLQWGPDWKTSEVKGNIFRYSKQNLGKVFALFSEESCLSLAMMNNKHK